MKFELTELEEKRVERWKKNHDCSDGLKRRITYKFTPTGIADSVTVECSCGDSKKVTDYGSW